MTKWFNQQVNEFFQTKLTERETDIIGEFTIVLALVSMVFVMFNAIFPNV